MHLLIFINVFKNIIEEIIILARKMYCFIQMRRDNKKTFQHAYSTKISKIVSWLLQII